MRFHVDVDFIHDGCKVVDRYINSLCKTLCIKHMHSSYKIARSFYLELVKRKKKGGGVRGRDNSASALLSEC